MDRCDKVLGLLKYYFRYFDGYNVKICHDPFVITAHDHEIKRFDAVEVELLMRYIRCEVDEITRTYFCSKFESLSPTNLATTSHDIDGNFVSAMMMRSRLCAWLESDRTDPCFLSSSTSKIKYRRTASPGRTRQSEAQGLGSHNLNAIGSPLYCFRHRQHLHV